MFTLTFKDQIGQHLSMKEKKVLNPAQISLA